MPQSHPLNQALGQYDRTTHLPLKRKCLHFDEIFMTALEDVILTISSAASDRNFVKMATFTFQCLANRKPQLMNTSSSWIFVYDNGVDI